MHFEVVKGKLNFSRNKFNDPKPASAVTLLLLAILSFIFSFLPVLPPALVERWFARAAFPVISSMFGYIADAVPFAWFDVLLLAALILLVVWIRRRHWFPLALTAALGYLVFFWSWGINYHREPLQSKLVLNAAQTEKSALDAFKERAANEINSLFGQIEQAPYDEQEIRRVAAERVALVVERLDGTHWRAASRIKESYLANAWLRFAGIDGFFNPIVHEPIVNPSVLNTERPFIIAHELAHVRGYPDEGEANFIALMATLMSAEPRLRYSGWLELWLYLRTKETDSLLDPGPRHDIQLIFDRLRSERIAWISNFQGAIFDWFLKANSVPEGVQSYAHIVLLASATQDTWDRFRE